VGRTPVTYKRHAPALRRPRYTAIHFSIGLVRRNNGRTQNIRNNNRVRDDVDTRDNK